MLSAGAASQLDRDNYDQMNWRSVGEQLYNTQPLTGDYRLIGNRQASPPFSADRQRGGQRIGDGVTKRTRPMFVGKRLQHASSDDDEYWGDKRRGPTFGRQNWKPHVGETRDEVPHSRDETGSSTLGRQETRSYTRETKQEAPHWGDKRRCPTFERRNRKPHIGETRDDVPHSRDETGSPTLGRQETIEVPYWEEQRRSPPYWGDKRRGPTLGRQETGSYVRGQAAKPVLRRLNPLPSSTARRTIDSEHGYGSTSLRPHPEPIPQRVSRWKV